MGLVLAGAHAEQQSQPPIDKTMGRLLLGLQLNKGQVRLSYPLLAKVAVTAGASIIKSVAVEAEGSSLGFRYFYG